MQMNVGQKTHVGLERENNQDDMAWFSLPSGELFIISDGMGGQAGGRTAAKMAIKVIKEIFQRNERPIQTLLETSVREANRKIHAKGACGDPRYKNMGATVAVMFVKDEKLYLAHVGDSRIYHFRGNRLIRLTKDHSQVQDLVDQGVIKPEKVMNDPRAHILSRAIGADPNVQVAIRQKPLLIRDGDMFLQCTDGLSGLVHDETIRLVLEQAQTVDQACDELVSEALQQGGTDNVTVQIVSFANGLDDSENKTETPKKEWQRGFDLLIKACRIFFSKLRHYFYYLLPSGKTKLKNREKALLIGISIAVIMLGVLFSLILLKIYPFEG